MVKQYKQQEILDLLPNNWNQITFDFYLNKLLKVMMSDSEDPLDIMQTNLEVTSLFLDMPVSIIEQFPLSTIKLINKKLSFLSEKPKKLTNSKIMWKSSFEEPTYDDFITFIKVSEQLSNNDLSNFPLLIKIVIKKEMTEDEILQLPMDEVEHGFFLLRTYSMKYLKSIMKDLTIKVIVEKMNQMTDQLNQVEGMKLRKRLGIIKKNYKSLMASISLQKMSQTSQD